MCRVSFFKGRLPAKEIKIETVIYSAGFSSSRACDCKEELIKVKGMGKISAEKIREVLDTTVTKL